MPIPTLKVLLGFGSSPAFTGYFVLNQSKLDSSALLAPDTVMVDVSQWITGQLTINRGRSRQTDSYTAGVCQFTLRNEDRRFDPTNAASPYYPGILPRAVVSVFLAGQQIFGGYVADYDLGYDMPSFSTMTVTAQDGFSLLAMTTLTKWQANEEQSGTRIANVLTRPEVSYPGVYLGDTGVALLQASLQDSKPALDHCQDATISEGGMFFVTRSGVLRFLDRTIAARQATNFPAGLLSLTDVPH